MNFNLLFICVLFTLIISCGNGVNTNDITPEQTTVIRTVPVSDSSSAQETDSLGTAIDFCSKLDQGGLDNWRMPTAKEFYTTVDFTRAAPMLNTNYFSFNMTNSSYWTVSPWIENPSQYWFISISSGIGESSDPETPKYFRCISGTFKKDSLTDNGNGTITDNNSGLIWQQVTNSGVISTLSDAVSYCDNLSLGGNIDWRLPRIDELISVVDFSKSNPAIDTKYFTGFSSSPYWSNSTDAGGSGQIWNLFFPSGSPAKYNSTDADTSHYALCVRGNMTSPSFTDNNNGSVTDSVNNLVWEKSSQ